MTASVNPPRVIAHTELWTARMQLDPILTHRHVQRAIMDYVTRTNISVVGYVTRDPSSLTLLRWPDIRPECRASSIEECDLTLEALARILRASDRQRDIIPANTLHTMMGTRVDGYNTAKFVPLSSFERPDISGYHVQPAHMVSARAVIDASGVSIEAYGEPVGMLTMPASSQNEAIIHEVGDQAGQWHYAIEGGRCEASPQGRTDFYETRWAQVEG